MRNIEEPAKVKTISWEDLFCWTNGPLRESDSYRNNEGNHVCTRMRWQSRHSNVLNLRGSVRCIMGADAWDLVSRSFKIIGTDKISIIKSIFFYWIKSPLSGFRVKPYKMIYYIVNYGFNLLDVDYMCKTY